MIGGPPHSGKSVLVYSLTQALRVWSVAHYVLRAYPDGEGDWANEADQSLVRRIRVKGNGTSEWIARICRDIANRHLPLIVDVGGRPTAWQEAAFDQCTHAVLLTPDADSRSRWRELAARHGLPLLADLHSSLDGDNLVQETVPILRGQISRLERGQTAQGPTLEALVSRLAAIFAYDETELRTAHLASAPAELVVELSRVGRALGLGSEWRLWSPEHLLALLDYLPAHIPLAIYDRGPNWLYAALALHTYPAQLYQFDVRLGWVPPPTLMISSTSPTLLLTTRALDRPTHTRLEMVLSESYLDYGEAEGLALAPLPQSKGVVLSGKLPLWMWTALARAYHDAPWIAIFQPQLQDKAIVIASQDLTVPVGSSVISRV